MPAEARAQFPPTPAAQLWTALSAALDQGVPNSPNLDFDGDPRPQGWAQDLGADEYLAVIFRLYLQLATR